MPLGPAARPPTRLPPVPASSAQNGARVPPVPALGVRHGTAGRGPIPEGVQKVTPSYHADGSAGWRREACRRHEVLALPPRQAVELRRRSRLRRRRRCAEVAELTKPRVEELERRQGGRGRHLVSGETENGGRRRERADQSGAVLRLRIQGCGRRRRCRCRCRGRSRGDSLLSLFRGTLRRFQGFLPARAEPRARPGGRRRLGGELGDDVGALEAERGVVVRRGGFLCGVEGAEPQPLPLARVADLRRELAPRPEPHAGETPPEPGPGGAAPHERRRRCLGRQPPLLREHQRLRRPRRSWGGLHVDVDDLPHAPLGALVLVAGGVVGVRGVGVHEVDVDTLRAGQGRPLAAAPAGGEGVDRRHRRRPQIHRSTCQASASKSHPPRTSKKSPKNLAQIEQPRTKIAPSKSNTFRENSMNLSKTNRFGGFVVVNDTDLLTTAVS